MSRTVSMVEQMARMQSAASALKVKVMSRTVSMVE